MLPKIMAGVLYSHWEIKGRFRKRVVLANVPSFRFSFRGNIRRNHLLETTLLGTPDTELALRPPQTFENISESLSE